MTPEQEGNMKAFPPAELGMSRFVLGLPVEEDEYELKVWR